MKSQDEQPKTPNASSGSVRLIDRLRDADMSVENLTAEDSSERPRTYADVQIANSPKKPLSRLEALQLAAKLQGTPNADQEGSPDRTVRHAPLQRSQILDKEHSPVATLLTSKPVGPSINERFARARKSGEHEVSRLASHPDVKPSPETENEPSVAGSWPDSRKGLARFKRTESDGSHPEPHVALTQSSEPVLSPTPPARTVAPPVVPVQREDLYLTPEVPAQAEPKTPVARIPRNSTFPTEEKKVVVPAPSAKPQSPALEVKAGRPYVNPHPEFRPIEVPDESSAADTSSPLETAPVKALFEPPPADAEFGEPATVIVPSSVPNVSARQLDETYAPEIEDHAAFYPAPMTENREGLSRFIPSFEEGSFFERYEWVLFFLAVTACVFFSYWILTTV